MRVVDYGDAPGKGAEEVLFAKGGNAVIDAYS